MTSPACFVAEHGSGSGSVRIGVPAKICPPKFARQNLPAKIYQLSWTRRWKPARTSETLYGYAYEIMTMPDPPAAPYAMTLPVPAKPPPAPPPVFAVPSIPGLFIGDAVQV